MHLVSGSYNVEIMCFVHGATCIYACIKTTVLFFLLINTVNDKSLTVRKLSRFLWIFIKPWKFSLLNFCSSESSDMYEGGDGNNRETFPRIPDEPSKPRNFSPSKLLSFTVLLNLPNEVKLHLHSSIGSSHMYQCMKSFVYCKQIDVGDNFDQKQLNPWLV